MVRWNYKPWVVHKRSYSFLSLSTSTPDQELLIVWQPNKKYLTQTKPNIPLTISYKHIYAPTPVDFNDYYNAITGPNGHHKEEDLDETYYGNYDKFETCRAVYQLTKKAAGDYEGIITNPPYPAKKGTNKQIGQAKWLLPALLGLATGLAAIPLLRALRAQPDE